MTLSWWPGHEIISITLYYIHTPSCTKRVTQIETLVNTFQLQIGLNHNLFQQTDRTCMQRLHDWVKGRSMSVSYIFIYMIPSKHHLQ